MLAFGAFDATYGPLTRPAGSAALHSPTRPDREIAVAMIVEPMTEALARAAMRVWRLILPGGYRAIASSKSEIVRIMIGVWFPFVSSFTRPVI